MDTSDGYNFIPLKHAAARAWECYKYRKRNRHQLNTNKSTLPHQDKFYHIFAETVSTQNWKDGMNLENFSALQWYEGMTKTDELTSKIQWIFDMCGCGVMLDNCLCFIFYLLFLKWAPFLQWEDWLLLSSGRQMLLETSTGSCQHKLRCYEPRTRGRKTIYWSADF